MPTNSTDAAARAEECILELFLALNRSAPGRWQALGVTPQQLRLLLELSAAGSLRPMQLAVRMDIHVSTLSGITDRLVERGLVDRTVALDDRRCSDLALTAAGTRVLRDLFAGECGTLRAALNRLGQRRLAQLERLLAAITAEFETGERRSPSAG